MQLNKLQLLIKLPPDIGQLRGKERLVVREAGCLVMKTVVGFDISSDHRLRVLAN